MTLDEARLNFGRTAVLTHEGIEEHGEIRGVWGEYVQFMVGEGHLRMVKPEWLVLA